MSCRFAGALALLAACAGVVVSVGATNSQAATASGWGTAQKVLSGSLPAAVSVNAAQVSCAAPGYCATGGTYTTSSGVQQAWIATEVKGAWGKAEEVPGIGSLDGGGSATTGWGAQLVSVSCPSVGYCAGLGDYAGKSGGHVFVVNEVRGTWQSAAELPGLGLLAANSAVVPTVVSCASAGNCAAGGNGPTVADERNGTWHSGQALPGLSALGAKDGTVTSVSCPGVGTCVAGGWYADSSGTERAFVADETNGTWHAPHQVSGTAPTAAGHGATVTSIACATGGNCVVGGSSYSAADGALEAFVATEAGYRWGAAEQVPGADKLFSQGATAVQSVSCPSAANCVVAGAFVLSRNPTREGVFVATEHAGTWGTATQVPSTGRLGATLGGLSCAKSGTCSLVGTYVPGSASAPQAFASDESAGGWHSTSIPGIVALDKGKPAQATSVSCAASGQCAAVGIYTPPTAQHASFAVTRT